MSIFSHTLHNPNNFVIETDCEVIPFGHRCTSAIACKCAGLRKVSLPFDWCIPAFPSKIQKVLENNFDDFIPDVASGNFTNKYGIQFIHFGKDINIGIATHNRRIDRFNDIIKTNKKIYFVYINEDYLYDKTYREDELNDSIFNEMLELETFLKLQYKNIDYNILYFNFKQHDIPPTSNIINIVLQTKTVYDSVLESPYEMVRYYCGQVLIELFNVKNAPPGYSYEFET